jgi:hypothetical protein
LQRADSPKLADHRFAVDTIHLLVMVVLATTEGDIDLWSVPCSPDNPASETYFAILPDGNLACWSHSGDNYDFPGISRQFPTSTAETIIGHCRSTPGSCTFSPRAPRFQGKEKTLGPMLTEPADPATGLRETS